MDTIVTTLGDLLNAEPVLKKLSLEPLPIKAAYHVAKIIRLVVPELKHFHDTRDAYIREFGAERDATEQEIAQGVPTRIFTVTDENREAYIEKVQALADVPVEIPWKPLKSSELLNTTLSAQDLMPLLDVFVVDDTSD